MRHDGPRVAARRLTAGLAVLLVVVIVAAALAVVEQRRADDHAPTGRRRGARRPGQRDRHARPHAAREPGRSRPAARPGELPAFAFGRDGRGARDRAAIRTPPGLERAFRLDAPTRAPAIAPGGPRVGCTAWSMAPCDSCPFRRWKKCASCAGATNRRRSLASAPTATASWSAASADRCTSGTSRPAISMASRFRLVVTLRSGSSIPATRRVSSRWRPTAGPAALCCGNVVIPIIQYGSASRMAST